MPWCEPCKRFYNPNSLNPDGTCPTCGGSLADGGEHGSGPAGSHKVPWHFWLLLAALTIYLGWRLIQAVAWLF